MRLRISLGVFLLVLPACGDRAVRSCTDLADAKSWEEATVRCGQVFEETGDPVAGAAAAKADYALGRYDQAMAWVARLKGKPVPPGLFYVAANVHLRRGEADLAEKAYRRDVEVSRAAGDHRRAAASLYGLYYLAWPASRYREAFDFAAGAFEEAAKAGDRELQSRSAEALYTILYSLGDMDGARRALEMASDLVPPEKVLDRARFRVNQGVLNLEEGRLALARHDLEEGLKIADGGGDALLNRGAHLNLAHTSLLLGDLDRAAENLRQAERHPDPSGDTVSLSFYKAWLERERGRPEAAIQSLRVALNQGPSPDWEWELEYERGRAEEDQGEIRNAKVAYESSAAVVEGMRKELGFDEFKSWLLDRKRQPFEALFLLSVREGQMSEAVAAIERAKARTFQDAFIRSASTQGPAAPEDWSKAVDRFEILEELLPIMNESPVASLRPVEQLLKTLGDRHVLVYFEAREEIWLMTVARGKTQARRLAAAAEVRGLVERFLANPDDRALAEALGSRLLPPGSLPASGETIHVVADGALGRLPFAALRTSGRALIEEHAIAYVPSLNALASVSDRTRRAWTAPVVLADPKGDLPAAAAEARQVAALLGIEPRVGPAASREEFRRASFARVLHLATHTGGGAGGAWLRLADDEEQAGEIVAARVHPRLTVLATCASALPAGRGMWGSLGAAFLAAGSEAVLASLWSIEDRPAREFVLRFYREGGAVEPASALARAQRSFLAEGRPPSFWAPFVTFGADRLLN